MGTGVNGLQLVYLVAIEVGQCVGIGTDLSEVLGASDYERETTE